MAYSEGKDGSKSKVKQPIWHFYGSFPATDVPRGLAHKGEEGINLDALMKGLASGAAWGADEGSAEPEEPPFLAAVPESEAA